MNAIEKREINLLNATVGDICIWTEIDNIEIEQRTQVKMAVESRHLTSNEKC